MRATAWLNSGAETERAFQVDLLGHDGVGRHRDLAARQIADLDDRAAAPDAGDRRGEAGRGARNLESNIEWSVGGKRLQFGVAAGKIDRPVCAEPAGEGERRRGYVGDSDLAAALEPGREHGQKPDRPGAEQDDILAAIVAGARHRVQADGERLGERRRLIGHMPRDLDALRRRGVEDAGEAALAYAASWKPSP